MKKLFLPTLFCFAAISGFSQFTTYTPPQTVEVRDIKSGAGKASVALATDKGIFWFERSTNTWTNFTTQDGLATDDVKALAYTNDGKLYASLGDGTVGYYNNNNWEVIPTPNEQDEVITVIYITNNDTSYGTSKGALYHKRSNTPTFRKVFIPSGGNPITTIHTMKGVPGQPDILIAPTAGDGVLLYAAANNFSFVVNSSGSPLPSDNVISGDVDGLIAYDGTDQGVYAADFSTFPQVTPTTFNTGNSVLPSNIIAATEANAGIQWFGTPAGLVHKSGTKWKVYTTANSNLSDRNVKRLYIDLNDNNSLWIATDDGKLNRLDDYSLNVSTLNKTISANYYPNPAHSKLTIELDNSESTKNSIRIFTPLGKTVFKTETLQGKTTLNVSGIKTGVYFIEITNLKGSFTDKITINN